MEECLEALTETRNELVEAEVVPTEEFNSASGRRGGSVPREN